MLVLSASVVLAACGGGSSDVSVHAELVRLGGNASASPIVQTGPAATPPGTIPWTSQVSLSSLKSPITRIEIRGSGTSDAPLYECSGLVADDCLVELNGPELSTLLSTDPVSVPVGTYDQVVVSYCGNAETEWNAYLTGTTTIGGVGYVTQTAGNLAPTGTPQPVPVRFHGCGAAFDIVPALVVSDTIAIPVVLRLYFDIRDIAYAALADPTTAEAGGGINCTPAAATDPFVCAAYTTIVAVPGTSPPAVERYRVNDAATVGLMFELGSGRFVGGYFRRFYVEDMPWDPKFTPDSFVESLVDNGDGTYTLTQVGGAVFPHWVRGDHTGSGNDRGTPFTYSAVRLP